MVLVYVIRVGYSSYDCHEWDSMSCMWNVGDRDFYPNFKWSKINFELKSICSLFTVCLSFLF